MFLAFFTGFLYKLVLATIDPQIAAEDPQYVNVITSQVLTVLGIADSLTGFVIGKLTSCFNPTQLAVIHISIGLFSIGLSMVQYQLQSFSLCLVVALLFGYIINTFSQKFIKLFYQQDFLTAISIAQQLTSVRSTTQDAARFLAYFV